MIDTILTEPSLPKEHPRVTLDDPVNRNATIARKTNKDALIQQPLLSQISEILRPRPTIVKLDLTSVIGHMLMVAFASDGPFPTADGKVVATSGDHDMLQARIGSSAEMPQLVRFVPEYFSTVLS